MATLDELNARLEHSATLLSGSTRATRELGLDPTANVRRIGEALACIFEIQKQIFELRPDLTPESLKR